MELFSFHIFVLNGCHILEMWQIILSEVAVFQLNSREGSVVDWSAMVGSLTQPYKSASHFTNLAVGR